MIEVSNLVKKYGDHTAVDHLSFQIEKGKIYGFLGPNGAGKSTTMNMITGYIASTEGKVMIDGHDILEEPEAAASSFARRASSAFFSVRFFLTSSLYSASVSNSDTSLAKSSSSSGSSFASIFLTSHWNTASLPASSFA